ncbi:MAG: F0F1 ATP synthase subunit delta [Prevotellaceae bacterium]|nr:F0F1 ATP synthase subunit delta [Prevotellaceae bacterium]
MDTGIISTRYAKALQRFAADNKESERVYAEMQALTTAFFQAEAFRLALINPVVPDAVKQELLTTAAAGQSSVLTQSSTRFFELLVRNKRTDFAPFIAHSFLSLYRRSKNLVSARLVLADNVSDTTSEALKQIIEKRTKGTVEFQTIVNPKIGGGFVLEYDTYRLDASLKTQLEKLHRSMRS